MTLIFLNSFIKGVGGGGKSANCIHHCRRITRRTFYVCLARIAPRDGNRVAVCYPQKGNP